MCTVVGWSMCNDNFVQLIYDIIIIDDVAANNPGTFGGTPNMPPKKKKGM